MLAVLPCTKAPWSRFQQEQTLQGVIWETWSLVCAVLSCTRKHSLTVCAGVGDHENNKHDLGQLPERTVAIFVLQVADCCPSHPSVLQCSWWCLSSGTQQTVWTVCLCIPSGTTHGNRHKKNLRLASPTSNCNAGSAIFACLRRDPQQAASRTGIRTALDSTSLPIQRNQKCVLHASIFFLVIQEMWSFISNQDALVAFML